MSASLYFLFFQRRTTVTIAIKSRKLQIAGPALALVYLFCGIFSFLILRALGELAMYHPTSGSFVSYAREFLGERGSFVAGWMYNLNWATTEIVDITAIAST